MALTVDTHIHAYEMERWDRRRIEPPHPWGPDPNPVEEVIARLDENGVAVAVQVTPLMMGANNEYSIDSARRYPDRVAVLVRFDPVQTDVRDAVRRLGDLSGVVGVRLTFFRGHEDEILDQDTLSPFWSAVTEYRVPVSVYAPRRLSALLKTLERHPECVLIVDHMGVAVHPGAPEPFAGVRLLREFAPFNNVSVKISGVCELSREPYPFRDVHDHLAQVLEWFGAERLLWGSDYPNVLKKCSYAESLRFIRDSSVFTSDQLLLVLGESARIRLGLDAALGAQKR